MKNAFTKGLSGLVSLTVPVVLSVLSVLILVSPVFVNIEYRRPGFPGDRYGFSTAERLQYGNLTRSYLVTKQSLDTLRELKFDSGEPLYQERELSHLEDVKVVLQGVLKVWAGAVFLLVLSGIYSRFGGWQDQYWEAVFRGGRLTALLVVAILVLTVVSFRALFTNFHLIFFEGDSWLFLYSDTLIRLFPMRFWQDAFLVFGFLTLAGGVLLGWVVPSRRK